jgi:hypothetical protein
MPIMTRADFETLSKKYLSKRDGTIREIDDLLDAYHEALRNGDGLDALNDLREGVEKFEREKEAKYRNAKWIRQSNKRKVAVATLREQVLFELRVREELRRIDQQLFEQKQTLDEIADEGMTQELAILRDRLKDQKVKVRAAADETVRLSNTLYEDVTEFFTDNGREHWRVSEGNDNPVRKRVWRRYFSTHEGRRCAQPAGLRIATVDLDSLLGDDDECEYLQFADVSGWTAVEKAAAGGMATAGKSLVGYEDSMHPPVSLFPGGLKTKLAAYLKALLGTDMRDEVATVGAALEGHKDNYRAVVHIDYYASREVTTVALHKDTIGNSLFVALHYLNGNEMMGPEYIDDPGPIAPQVVEGTQGYYRDEVYLRHVQKFRRGAPWAAIDKSSNYVWPVPLLDALQLARVGRGLSGFVQGYKTLPPNGLITFIDELVFHTTPFMDMREAGLDTQPTRLTNSGVTIAGYPSDQADSAVLAIFGERNYRLRVQRRLSTEIRNETDLPPAKDGDGPNPVRKFWRLWVTIVPRNWYRPLFND